jgi:hypothetical protein
MCGLPGFARYRQYAKSRINSTTQPRARHSQNQVNGDLLLERVGREGATKQRIA